MKHIIFPLLLLLGWSSASGQTYKQYMKAADQEFLDKNYYSAMKHYQTAMEIEGEQLEVLFKYAESARLFASYTYADTAYTKILEADTSKIYPQAKYWLATVKKKLGQYEESQSLFQQFVEEAPLRLSKFAEKAQKEVEELNWAIEAITKVDEDVAVEQLDEKVNSPYSEFAPTQVGNEVYFSTQNFFRKIKKGEPERMFSKVMKKEVGSQKVELVDWNDEKRHTAHTTFTDDGKRLFYTLCDYVGETAEIRCELFYRDIDDFGKFEEPVKLPSSINRPGYTVTDPRIGTDQATGETWLFFVSDRPGGQGGSDIWVTVMDGDSFSPPVNLEGINTPGEEVTPMFHNPSQTLYFSTDGRQTLGGFDIYKSVRRNGKWEDIEHLPVPYNSSYDDTHFWLDRGRVNGYFASSRLGSHVLEPEFEACCNDLYKFTVKVIDLEILTFNKKDSEPLDGATIQLFEMTPDGEFELATSTNEGGNDFPFQLKKGTKYLAVATRPSFLPLREIVDLTKPENTKERTLQRKLYLVPETVDLDVFSFNKKTMHPLKSVEVRLVIDGQEVDFKKNEESNDVTFVLERGEVYELIGSKVAYFSDTVIIDLTTDVTTLKIKEDLLLKPKEIEDFPPLVIYFDNDRPNPRTRKTTTEFAYKETWEEYMKKKDLYRTEYVKSLEGFDSITSARRMDAFFDREVKNGYLSLEVFTENILEIMDDGGFKVELVIQGFTSPRASADYNFNLSQRRSDCLKNHFERWNGGVLKPYIDQGRITLEVVGYGEELAPQFISDRLDDERESIYSVQASFERKVAIIGARRVAEN